ncbi:uncharacterized protein [Physcomitrium patens]|uniref:Uncharacterized protein n=1 Tax=Physcomitrium patens TaxID=3218 RepID=A0A2K1IIF2_PHYPA|nr:protein RCC2 homolog isoform X2 [Physcomitrium patens]PNR29054.1 hypothetical protein PHYPA_027746 [Physcomitrium patens]|eukprot:XP_024361801.1 protein RCC2 homolog isoform X2 [Physcomitrella patens]
MKAAAAQVSDGGKKSQEEAKPSRPAGELLFCGSSSWETIGKKQTGDGSTLLPSPTRLSVLQGVPIVFVAGGSTACHCIALDTEGRTYTWGRNEKGQLGHGDTFTRNSPTIVASLARHKVVKAALGRTHTIVITAEGQSLGFGFNKHGQLGSGSCKEEFEKSPVKCLVQEATSVSCGADFTVWLSSASGSSILSAGLPQYGQLGHGTDNEYNAKEASVKLVYEAQPRPRPIAAIASKSITKVACGNNHSVAVDSDGYVYTWGFGGHGRLGHKEQKDEFLPRLVETFQRGNVLPSTAVIAAGSAYSAATAAGGQLYMWGRVKTTGDNWMYPKPVMDLSGWNIRSLDCGNTSSIAAAEDSCISWGTGVYGELGYGPTGPKSSANPKKIDALEGFHTISVACGLGHSLFIVDREKNVDKLEQIDVFEGVESTQVPESKDEEALSNDKKRKAPAKGRGKAAKKKIESESEDDEDVDDESDDEPKPKARGKAAGRGRGRGRPPSAKNGHVEASAKGPSPAAKGRGRGRPRGRGK